MVDINQKNFNNPQNLQLSNSFSTISTTLNNPFVSKPIQYGDFRSSDPVLNSMLPSVINLGKDNGNANNMKDVFNGYNNFNLGLTSPGFVDNAMKCTGLDFVNTNPDYNKLPFQVCQNKFNSQYQIPEIAFNNLMNNLPYTFSALSPDEQKRYLSSLKNFIDTESTKNGINMNDMNNLKENYQTINNEITSRNNTKENFGSGREKDCSSSSLSLSGILSIVLIVIIILVFLLFIANKN
uniref:Uncharacterized protein n=1 Tax=viral metagenome TaxID=1070528 RepID=A0A6C0LEC2_9ZZZZ